MDWQTYWHYTPTWMAVAEFVGFLVTLWIVVALGWIIFELRALRKGSQQSKFDQGAPAPRGTSANRPWPFTGSKTPSEQSAVSPKPDAKPVKGAQSEDARYMPKN